jgi:hypothetical protein
MRDGRPCLRPEQIAKTLLEHAGYVSAADRTGTTTLDSEMAEPPDDLRRHQAHTGHDSPTTEGTLLRRRGKARLPPSGFSTRSRTMAEAGALVRSSWSA